MPGREELRGMEIEDEMMEDRQGGKNIAERGEWEMERRGIKCDENYESWTGRKKFCCEGREGGWDRRE